MKNGGADLWREIKRAARKRQYITLEYRHPEMVAEVSTVEGGPPWEADVLIRVKVYRRGWDWQQLFASVSKAEEALNAECRKLDRRE